MAFLIGGIVILLGIMLVGRSAIRLDRRSLKRVLKWVAIAGLVLVLLWLVSTGRLASALAAGGAALTMLVRWGPLLARIAMALRAHTRASAAGWQKAEGPGASAGLSTVESAFFSMTLDHDSARMDGRVLQGRFSGRMLGSLGLDDLLALLRDCATDAESARLLEAYLDRRFGADWRTGQTQPRADAPMTRADALAELGLVEGASEAQIRDAYRQRMRKVHPDHGGTDAQAARVNRARDILLGV